MIYRINVSQLKIISVQRKFRQMDILQYTDPNVPHFQLAPCTRKYATFAFHKSLLEHPTWCLNLTLRDTANIWLVLQLYNKEDEVECFLRF